MTNDAISLKINYYLNKINEKISSITKFKRILIAFFDNIFILSTLCTMKIWRNRIFSILINEFSEVCFQICLI